MNFETYLTKQPTPETFRAHVQRAVRLAIAEGRDEQETIETICVAFDKYDDSAMALIAMEYRRAIESGVELGSADARRRSLEALTTYSSVHSSDRSKVQLYIAAHERTRSDPNASTEALREADRNINLYRAFLGVLDTLDDDYRSELDKRMAQ